MPGLPIPKPSPASLHQALTSRFLNIVDYEIRARGLAEPGDDLKRAIVGIAERLTGADIPTLPTAPTEQDDFHAKQIELTAALTAEQQFNADVICAAGVACIIQFLSQLPKPEHVLWYVRAQDVLPLGQAVANVVTPFFKTPGIKPHCQYVRDKYMMGAREAAEKKGLARDKLIYPEEYQAPDILRRYLLPEFQALFHCKVPFGYEDETRFWHQWIMASWGTGKTTLLAAHIAADLDRVARNECSILVMDSQDRLVPDIARLKGFAPGQPMHDRLIYIEPDLDYPPALNIFDRKPERFASLSRTDRYALKMATLEMMDFFFSSALALTAKQETPFHFILSAAMEIPGANIFTFRELLRDDGWERYKDILVDRLDDDVIGWFEEHYRKPGRGVAKDIYAETRQEISHRIEGIYKDELFRKMFGQPDKKLDLFEELQRGKVILINSKRGILRKNIEPWGRFFIMQLLQAVEERSLVARSKNLPCFCYLDEAGDYISREPNLKKIFTQARKQRVGMTIAHHDEQDIEDARVMAALRGAGIRLSPAGNYAFNFDVRDKPTITMRLPEEYAVDFSRELQMKPEQWDVVLAEQRAKYCVEFASNRRRAEPAAEPGGFQESHDE